MGRAVSASIIEGTERSNLRYGQAGEGASKQDQGNRGAKVHPQARILGRFRQVVVREGVDGALEDRQSSDDGREAVEETGEHRVEAGLTGRKQAIDAARRGARGADGGCHSWLRDAVDGCQSDRWGGGGLRVSVADMCGWDARGVRAAGYGRVCRDHTISLAKRWASVSTVQIWVKTGQPPPNDRHCAGCKGPSSAVTCAGSNHSNDDIPVVMRGVTRLGLLKPVWGRAACSRRQ